MTIRPTTVCRPLYAAALLSAIALTGCEQAAEEPSQAPSAQAPETTAPDQPADAAPDQSPDMPELLGVVPEGWVFDPAPRQMRLATFMIPDEDGEIELAITQFGGRVGGELPNINRWRRQMGLAPIEEADLESVITRFESDGFEGYEARIESETGVLLASAVYEAAEDRTWFVRVTTTPAAADRVQTAVFGFGRSMIE